MSSEDMRNMLFSFLTLLGGIRVLIPTFLVLTISIIRSIISICLLISIILLLNMEKKQKKKSEF
nr:MAG TPA: hypothetical protein [Caudoviricetes sp.]